MSRKIYPVPDASKIIGVSRQWVYRLLDLKRIEEATDDDLREAGINPELVPDRRFITEEALNAYIGIRTPK